jgi:hypothetical protein
VLGCLTLLEVALLAYVGGNISGYRLAGKKDLFSVSHGTWPYTYCALLRSGFIHSVMLIEVDLASPKSCGYWFKLVSTAVGFCKALRFVVQYVLWSVLQMLGILFLQRKDTKSDEIFA